MKEILLKHKVEEEDIIKNILIKKFDISSRLLRKLKLNKRICCNGKVAWVNGTAKIGDEITANIYFEEPSDSIKSEAGELDILYEDDSLLIVNKCGNMVVHPTCIHQEGTLANYVKKYLEEKGEFVKIRFVNRIDRETSGITVLAKNEYSQDILSKQMQQGIFKKEYTAIVYGIVDKDRGIIDLPIKREPDSIMTRMTADDGEKAVTHYEVIKRLNGLTVLKLRLETGRTHQIRVHCKAIGHPIVGDGLYSNIKTDLIGRQALHAHRVSFIHPVTKEEIDVEAQIPEDISNLMKGSLAKKKEKTLDEFQI